MKTKLLLVYFIFAFLYGCAEKPGPANNSDLSQVNRIISAAPSVTEIIVGLGLADKLVAVDKYSGNIAGVRKGLPEIDFFNPDMEAIASLKPDIIISGEINTNGNSGTPFAFFRQLGITVIQIQTSNSIEDIYSDIATIADALGIGEKGQKMAADMRKQIEAIAASAKSGGQGSPSVYFEIAPAPNIVSFGSGTYLNELIEITGARNIFAGEKRWFTPSAEAIIGANPGIIFILDGASDIEEIKNRPGFKSIAAVAQNRIFVINADYASRPSQNIVLALKEMYRAVYPQ